MYKLFLCLRYLRTRYLAFVCIVSVKVRHAPVIHEALAIIGYKATVTIGAKPPTSSSGLPVTTLNVISATVRTGWPGVVGDKDVRNPRRCRGFFLGKHDARIETRVATTVAALHILMTFFVASGCEPTGRPQILGQAAVPYCRRRCRRRSIAAGRIFSTTGTCC